MQYLVSRETNPRRKHWWPPASESSDHLVMIQCMYAVMIHCMYAVTIHIHMCCDDTRTHIALYIHIIM